MNRQGLNRFAGLGAVLGATLALAGTAGAQTDHSAAPMMAPAKAPLSEEAYREQQAPGGRRDDADTITARFRDRFSGDGEARIAVLWNEALSSRVSDWQSRQRATVGVRGEFWAALPTDLRRYELWDAAEHGQALEAVLAVNGLVLDDLPLREAESAEHHRERAIAGDFAAAAAAKGSHTPRSAHQRLPLSPAPSDINLFWSRRQRQSSHN